MILDECDYGIDNYSCTFKTGEHACFLGMAALKAAKAIYFMSATFDQYHYNYLADLFGV